MIDSGDELFVESSLAIVRHRFSAAVHASAMHKALGLKMLVSYSTLGYCLSAGAMNAFVDAS